jgi:hypothetical protein
MINKKYIIIAILVIILLINIYNNTFKEGHQDKTGVKKGLLVLYGESFREGNQGERLRDTKKSFKTQKTATTSHIDFCNNIKTNHNIDFDILINTYDTKYEKNLKKWYEKNNLKYITNPELIGFQSLVQNAINSIDLNNYDFIFFTRMDIVIKPHFYNIFNPNWNKIYFVCQNWTLFENCGFFTDSKNIPVVNPIFVFIPRNYFKVLDKVNVDHNAWDHYMKEFNLNNNDMDFMIDEYHDADSFKDNNPLYYFAGRPENQVWHDKDRKIDRTLFGKDQKVSC